MHWKPAVLLAVGLLLLAAGIGLAGDVEVQEAPLNPAGEAYELNRDAAGALLVSDYGAGEIRRVDPATGSYVAYGVAGPIDARGDASGRIWFTDGAEKFGYIDQGAGTITIWAVGEPGEVNLYGLAFDDAGGVWITEWFGSASVLRRFDPATHELCSYALPGGTISYYILYRDGALWLANWSNDWIYRFTIATGEARWWQLSGGNSPAGLTFDTGGNLWWADSSKHALLRLNAGSNQVRSYPLPTGSAPQMLVFIGEGLWYTESGSGTVGLLDPAVAGSSTSGTSSSSEIVASSCRNVGSGMTTAASTTNGAMAWTGRAWPAIVKADGWTVYQLPSGAYPWGIAALESVWVVDQGRHVLAKLAKQTENLVYLPLVTR